MEIPCPLCKHTLIYDQNTWKCLNRKCKKFNVIQIGTDNG